MALNEFFVNNIPLFGLKRVFTDGVDSLGGYIAKRYVGGPNDYLYACTVKVPQKRAELQALTHCYYPETIVYSGQVPVEVGHGIDMLEYAINSWNSDFQQRERDIASGIPPSVDALVILKKPRSLKLSPYFDETYRKFQDLVAAKGGRIFAEFMSNDTIDTIDTVASCNVKIPDDKMDVLEQHPLVKAVYTRPVPEVDIKRSRDRDFQQGAGVWNYSFVVHIPQNGQAERLRKAIHKGA